MTRHDALPEGFDRLLEEARAGHEEAWREIYAALAPGVLGYLRARGATDAEDLAGEVFLQVVRDLPSFSGPGSGFRAWAFTIAHNRLLDERRREARRPAEPVGEPPDPPAPGVDAEAEALDRLGLERVTRILASLSADQRDVLLLRIVGDLALDEVARVLGKRTGAVKQLQRRGLAAARRQLEREGSLR